MAKKKAKKKRRLPSGSAGHAGTATAEADPVAGEGNGPDEAMAQAGHGGQAPPSPSGTPGGRGEGPGRPSTDRRKGGGFFEVYKRGQGYYTRMGTAITAGVLILAGANYIHEQLGGALPADAPWALYVQNGVPLAAILGFGLLTYWLVGANRRTCDFMIATEGEMKKVNWSSRATVIGSTKIVIICVVLMGTMLFIVNTFFMFFFNSIGVLKVAPSILKKLLNSDT